MKQARRRGNLSGRDNIIRYNYVLAGAGGEVGIGTKSWQELSTARDGSDLTYRDRGDAVHHNIIKGVGQWRYQ